MRRKLVHSVIVIVLLVVFTACGDKANNHSPVKDLNAKRSELKGTLTAMDGKRALIVSKDANNPANKTPTAVWIDFIAEVSLTDVQIGSQVKAETDGMMLESYPMQTKGYKLEVVSSVVGKGDLEGTVTALGIVDGDGNNNTIEVDGDSYSLLPYTKYLVNTEPAGVKDIKVGDQVEVWFPGYQVMEERLITQVKIVR